MALKSIKFWPKIKIGVQYSEEMASCLFGMVNRLEGRKLVNCNS